MRQTVGLNDFRSAFQSHGRENQFSYEGLEVLFDWLEAYEEGTDTELELDVIALCCDFSEDTPEEIQRYYSIEHDADNEEDLADAVKKYLEENSVLCGETSDGSLIYQQF